MTISVWRFSHLMLALVSSVFIVLASITGMILALEPISNQLQNYTVNQDITVAATIKNVTKHYNDIITIETDENDFVIASVITNKGENDTFYINPDTGKKLGGLIEKAPVFRFTTNLHRSLFLKSTGRFIVGLVSFFLILMAISGIILIVKRQGGIRRYFSKVINENFEQYYHVVIGRWLLIPIVIVAMTGVYLSLEKFSLLPETTLSHNYPEAEIIDIDKIPVSEFKVFKSLKIGDVKRLEFPFSEDVEDYFFIKLKDKELLVHQYSGAIVSKQEYPLVKLISQWSLFLHTGQGTIMWSMILFIVCMALLFFIYSGFAMYVKRRKKTGIPKNKYTKDTSEIIILVGSETGSTINFANLFYNALIVQGKSVFISKMNAYSTYQQAKHIIIFTSTYGEGDAPISANKFKGLLETKTQTHTIDYAIVGFGSLRYPDYCKYAEDVDDLLKSHNGFQQMLELFKINNQSFDAFQTWVKQWCTATHVTLKIEQSIEKFNSKNTREFRVVKRTDLNDDQTFMLYLKPIKKVQFQSGDLLAIQPDVNEARRQYSIAKINNEVVLSIKKHEKGVCSSYLSKLFVDDTITATIEHNREFHFPKTLKPVIMIANGTGIAPFLGMIHDNLDRQNLHLFLGLRNKASYQLYAAEIEAALHQQKLKACHLAYSREQFEKVYVQDLISQKTEWIANHLNQEGIIMICGSIAMQKQVFKQLHHIVNTRFDRSLKDFIDNGQIKTDCY